MLYVKCLLMIDFATSIWLQLVLWWCLHLKLYEYNAKMFYDGVCHSEIFWCHFTNISWASQFQNLAVCIEFPFLPKIRIHNRKNDENSRDVLENKLEAKNEEEKKIIIAEFYFYEKKFETLTKTDRLELFIFVNYFLCGFISQQSVLTTRFFCKIKRKRWWSAKTFLLFFN